MGSAFLEGAAEAQQAWADVSSLDRPVAQRQAGGGHKRLFPRDSKLASFELAEGKLTSSGTVIATYRPVR